MSDNSKIPDGFAPLSDPDASAPKFTIVDADVLTEGSIVLYQGIRTWQNAKGEHRRVHTFEFEEDEGTVLCALWSTAVLDRLLAQVSVGERTYLRYDGLVPHPTLTSRTVHQWTVARAVANAASGARAAAKQA